MRCKLAQPLSCGNCGFTYIGLLFAVAMIGIGLAVTGTVWSVEARRAKERELNFIGQQFVNAISSYYNSTPGAVKSYPPSFEELVLDSRFLFVRRHLRKIYVNPYTQKIDWEFIPSELGGIKGVRCNIGTDDLPELRSFTFVPQPVAAL